MGFECKHCGSNRDKKVNGETVCADCGHPKDRAVSSKNSTETKRYTYTPEETIYVDRRGMTNEKRRKLIARIPFFLGVLVFFVAFALAMSQCFTKPQNSKRVNEVEVIKGFSAYPTSAYTTSEQTTFHIRLVGTIKNVSSVELNNVEWKVAYVFDGVTKYVKDVIEVWHIDEEYEVDYRFDILTDVMDIKDFDLTLKRLYITLENGKIYTFD